MDADITDYSQTTDMTCIQNEQIVYRGHTRSGVVRMEGSGMYFWIDDATGRYMEQPMVDCFPTYRYPMPETLTKPRIVEKEHGQGYVW